MFVFDTGRRTGPRYIINFPTKRHWKGNSRIEDIDAGLSALVREIRQRQIHSIAVPPLGCGLGGLDWNDVRPRIVEAFDALPDVQLVLFEPGGAPEAATMPKERRVPNMTPGRAVLIELISRYLAAVLDPFVTLLEIHKLMYFMQEAGQDLKLNYEKGLYGPYATNLRPVLNIIEGHFITGYGDAGDDPRRPIEPLPCVAAAASQFLASHPDTHARFDRVARLIHGFETPYASNYLPRSTGSALASARVPRIGSLRQPTHGTIARRHSTSARSPWPLTFSPRTAGWRRSMKTAQRYAPAAAGALAAYPCSSSERGSLRLPRRMWRIRTVLSTMSK